MESCISCHNQQDWIAGDNLFMMDPVTYEQVTVERALFQDQSKWLTEGMDVSMSVLSDGEPVIGRYKLHKPQLLPLADFHLGLGIVHQNLESKLVREYGISTYCLLVVCAVLKGNHWAMRAVKGHVAGIKFCYRMRMPFNSRQEQRHCWNLWHITKDSLPTYIMTTAVRSLILNAGEVAKTLTFEVKEAEPYTRGDTAGSTLKACVLENGVQIMVPPFVVAGQKIVVNTVDSSFVRRYTFAP